MLVTAIPGASVRQIMTDRNEVCAHRGAATALVPWQAAVDGATTAEVTETFDVPADVAELARRLAKEGCMACVDHQREVPPDCPHRRDAFPTMAISKVGADAVSLCNSCSVPLRPHRLPVSAPGEPAQWKDLALGARTTSYRDANCGITSESTRIS